MFSFHIGPYVEIAIKWLNKSFAGFFDVINTVIGGFIGALEDLLLLPPAILLIAIVTVVAYRYAGKRIALFSFLGLTLIYAMELWGLTMSTVAMVLSSAFITLLFGIPLGILSAKSDSINKVIKPILDFMQTMPAFVYLIPAVLFFGLGKVPGSVATVIFSMPPVVRLTNLGIRQVPSDVIEAAISFGATSRQMLTGVQLPLALPTIMAGVNQTIMLSLSMVVISSMIGAGGLGDQVLRGITQFEIGLGFEAGLGVVILAMILDRLTQVLAKNGKSES